MILREVRKITYIAVQVGGEEFAGMLAEEVKHNIEGHWDVLTNEELEELVHSSIKKEDEEETETEPAM